ncbi:alpha/beta hydrolase [Microbacterium sp. 22303]|uniref:alpha/beta hydrolase n=1 Tax=Microbacterium sp. 22303 TaxID=3453905 RepID=UPI003F8467D5
MESSPPSSVSAAADPLPAESLLLRRPDGSTLPVERYPSPRPDSPTVIYLHGGGWVTGSCQDHPERLAALAARGVSVLSVGYRTVDRAPFPSQRDDVEAVIDALAPTGTGVFLMGASAGAHLAALIGYTRPHAVDGVIGLFGRYDLTAAGDELRPAPGLTVPAEILRTEAGPDFTGLDPRSRLALLAGAPLAALDDEMLAALSPTSMIMPAAPPTLLLHGTRDAVVDHRHSERLAARAAEVDVPCRLVLVAGANHEDPAFAEPPAIEEIARFVTTFTPAVEENHE